MTLVKTLTTIIALATFVATAKPTALVKVEPVAQVDLVKLAQADLKATLAMETENLLANKLTLPASASKQSVASEQNKAQQLTLVNYAE